MISTRISVVIAGVVALIVFLVTYFFMRIKGERVRAELETLRPVVRQKEELDKALKEEQVLRARIEEKMLSTTEKLEWTEKAEEKLREAFESLSSQALRLNANEIQKRSSDNLEEFKKRLDGDWNTQRESFKNIVDPIGKELEKLDKQVQEIEKTRKGAYQSLTDQVIELVKRNQELQTATVSLSTALRSTRTRGKWGEVQLRRIAEMAGMIDHVDFEEQAQVDGQRPDMTVRLPNEGIIPVDAKAPMDAYLDAQETTTEEDMTVKLAAHAKALRAHMNSLAKKAYWSQFPRSPDFVVMLIPYESGLTTAFQSDPALLDDALDSKVLIVSPVTLLALLKTTALGWMQLKLAKNAQEIADQGKEIASRFGKFLSYFSDIGSKLDSAMTIYNRAISSAERRLMPSFRKLSEMTLSSEVPETPPSIENKAQGIEEGQLAFGTEDIEDDQ
ncbi:MAG: DNA recombination protein RmuC [Spirochaetales bacterium]|jgi:DNA recombination protein RmuC|nr:DNA recombination protein RmuC [Spirochaetales bacterium]